MLTYVRGFSHIHISTTACLRGSGSDIASVTLNYADAILLMELWDSRIVIYKAPVKNLPDEIRDLFVY